jgi:hypothetical protein
MLKVQVGEQVAEKQSVARPLPIVSATRDEDIGPCSRNPLPVVPEHCTQPSAQMQKHFFVRNEVAADNGIVDPVSVGGPSQHHRRDSPLHS